MPAVWRELGGVQVTIVGPHPPPEVQALASPLVDVTGWIEDLRPLLERARLMVAPLRYGAGMKGKVTQALATGLPVVTTPIGAEGLDGHDKECLLIADDPQELRRPCDPSLPRRRSLAEPLARRPGADHGALLYRGGLGASQPASRGDPDIGRHRCRVLSEGSQEQSSLPDRLSALWTRSSSSETARRVPWR